MHIYIYIQEIVRNTICQLHPNIESNVILQTPNDFVSLQNEDDNSNDQISSNTAHLKEYSICIVDTKLSLQMQQKLDKYCRKLYIPQLILQSVGFLGTVRISIKHHIILRIKHIPIIQHDMYSIPQNNQYLQHPYNIHIAKLQKTKQLSNIFIEIITTNNNIYENFIQLYKLSPLTLLIIDIYICETQGICIGTYLIKIYNIIKSIIDNKLDKWGTLEELNLFNISNQQLPYISNSIILSRRLKSCNSLSQYSITILNNLNNVNTFSNDTYFKIFITSFIQWSKIEYFKYNNSSNIHDNENYNLYGILPVVDIKKQYHPALNIPQEFYDSYLELNDRQYQTFLEILSSNTTTTNNNNNNRHAYLPIHLIRNIFYSIQEIDGQKTTPIKYDWYINPIKVPKKLLSVSEQDHNNLKIPLPTMWFTALLAYQALINECIYPCINISSSYKKNIKYCYKNIQISFNYVLNSLDSIFSNIFLNFPTSNNILIKTHNPLQFNTWIEFGCVIYLVQQYAILPLLNYTSIVDFPNIPFTKQKITHIKHISNNLCVSLEIARTHGTAIPTQNSIIGSIGAQEALKILSHYAPTFNNTLVFNGIHGQVYCFCIQ